TSGHHARDMASRTFGLVLLVAGTSPANAIDANQTASPQGSRPIAGVSASGGAASDPTTPIAAAEVAFEPAHRAVSNWRTEAMDNLGLFKDSKTDSAGGSGLSDIPRCVKLNNYWCIKRARWAGEIAADAEGHVAFASAIDGAIAAAMLLRRYYLDYHLRSALAILSRWAPAQCAGGRTGMVRSRTPGATYAAFLASDAPHGIQNTLRARWLATHRHGFTRPDKTRALRRSIVRSWPLAMMPAPEIAVGMGEPKRAPIPLTKVAALEFATPVTEGSGIACASETTRIQNYASRAIEGIAASPNGDLNLFLADGEAGENLSRLLENMAKVEIGPLAARAGLIAAAIDRLTPRTLAAGMPRPGDQRGGASGPRE
ncbi:MAG TPA: hypothetical protein VMU78_05990, partial [Methylocella sp.]|nr:hypothetical protein [Methylocella sp.]